MFTFVSTKSKCSSNFLTNFDFKIFNFWTHSKSDFRDLINWGKIAEFFWTRGMMMSIFPTSKQALHHFTSISCCFQVLFRLLVPLHHSPDEHLRFVHFRRWQFLLLLSGTLSSSPSFYLVPMVILRMPTESKQLPGPFVTLNKWSPRNVWCSVG